MHSLKLISLFAASLALLITSIDIPVAHAQAELSKSINNNYKSIRNKSGSYACYVDFSAQNETSTKVTIYDAEGFMRTLTVVGLAGHNESRLPGTPSENAKKFCSKNCSTMDYNDNINKESDHVNCDGDNAGLTGFDSFGCDLSVLNTGQFYALGSDCVIYNNATGCPAYGGFSLDEESGVCVNAAKEEAKYTPGPNE